MREFGKSNSVLNTQVLTLSLLNAARSFESARDFAHPLPQSRIYDNLFASGRPRVDVDQLDSLRGTATCNNVNEVVAREFLFLHRARRSMVIGSSPEHLVPALRDARFR